MPLSKMPPVDKSKVIRVDKEVLWQEEKKYNDKRRKKNSVE